MNIKFKKEPVYMDVYIFLTVHDFCYTLLLDEQEQEQGTACK